MADELSKNLGRVLPPADPTDPFDRQRWIDRWNQSLIEKQVALVLGCGGLGCSVSFTLSRLGIKKIIMIDYDIVDMSNLNRQILFSRESVGKLKVESAAIGLKPHLVGNTEVETHNFDVNKNWAKVVELAKNSTVIFNNIDIGHYFDFAILSLGKNLGIPVSAGSSYARTWVVEYFSGKPSHSSFSYTNKDGDMDIFNRLVPSEITKLPNLEFVPKDNNPNSRAIGSNVLVCTMAGLQTVNHWVQSLMGFEMPNFTKSDISTFWKPGEDIAWPHPTDDA